VYDQPLNDQIGMVDNHVLVEVKLNTLEKEFQAKLQKINNMTQSHPAPGR
jgi:hypothetical protein